ncbi:AGE family epimerase/isomerase [Teredinibacter haidensis]|uniref:AGE family epimerase/isomerase n=1 Tax=Teredinibacter haidensis TaxID=2731755 RepID=UPI00094905F0|nr:AGE family epimerase/isomerase [Teredinibacter haidensis]
MSEHLISEIRAELHEIADWWLVNTPDEENGGFIGEISVDNVKQFNADKGIILNTRILWFFSEAALFTGKEDYKLAAERAYAYLTEKFFDNEHGGVYWALDATGKCVNDRKQIYAQAFAIYGLSAFYKLTQNEEALEKAMAIFELIETRGHDDERGGYLEAFGREWQPLEDMRLSDKDLNSPKSMNTHLHILEGYTALYVANPSDVVANAMKRCLGYFDTQIINKENNHLRMFQSMDWSDMSTSISYGHDIESSWLIWEAVEALGDEALEAHYRPIILAMAKTILEQGIGANGEVLDAYNFETSTLLDERVWWVQAEAMVGFLNAYELTDEKAYYTAFENAWSFIKQYQKDNENGEWHWLSTLDKPHVGDCKIGFWKAPYHNGRAMMEVCKLFVKLAEE